MDANALLKLALPFIAAAVSYALQRDNLSKSVNTLIAGVVTLLSALLAVFIQGKLTGDVYADFLLIAAMAASLQADSFAPLQQYLRSNFLSSSLQKRNQTKEDTGASS